MKVLLINGSPHPKGCTYTDLELVANELERVGIETETLQIYGKPVHGCIACNHCRQGKRCVFEDDRVNEAIAKMRESDGLVIGTPVHYASPAGTLIAFLDRMFYAGPAEVFAHKPCAVIANCRRSGGTASVDALEKYASIAQMPIVSSTYWNVTHGNTPDELAQDKEGVQTIRMLGRNMAWLLQCIDAGKKAGIKAPTPVMRKEWTNFIR